MMALGGSYHHPFQTSQYFIQRSEQEALDMAPVIGVTLYHANQVININIPMLDRPWMPMVPMVLRLGHLKGWWALLDREFLDLRRDRAL
jgi:hypothetical protein